MLSKRDQRKLESYVNVRQEEPVADEKKIWKVVLNVPREELENTLNFLADAGYQIHSKERVCTDVASGDVPAIVYTFDITAFDPQLLGAKHAQSMVASMGLGSMMAQMQQNPATPAKSP